MRRRAATLLLAVLGAVASRAGAQTPATQSGNTAALASVAVALSGSAIRNLDFGTVTPGVNQPVATRGAQSCVGCTSGLWTFLKLNPANNAEMRYAALTFTVLPSALTHASGATLPVSWANAAEACLAKGGVEYYCYPKWTPVQGVKKSLLLNGAGSPPTPPGGGQRDMNVYLGGTATPATNQRAGSYIGTVTLQFAYSST